MSRARQLGRALAQGGKGTAVAGGSGVGTYYLHKLLSTKVEAVQKHPIATPVAMIVLGHVLKRRMPTVASGLIGAGGYALGLAIDVQRAQKAAAGTSNTAALLEPGNVAALLEPGNVGAYTIPDAADEDDGDLAIDSAMNLGT